MAKKGRAARILNTLHKVNGTKQSEALKRRERKRPSKEFGKNVTGEDGKQRAINQSEWQKKRQRRREFEEAKGDRAYPQGYHGGLKTFTIGDGGFSFSLALVTCANGDGQNLTATTKSEPPVIGRKSRKNGKGVRNDDFDTVEALLDADVTVVHRFDCSDRIDRKQTAIKMKSFDLVYFNFPDCGFGASTIAPTLLANEQLLESTFERASELLKTRGELRVTCFDDMPAAMTTLICEKIWFQKEKSRFRLKAKVPFDSSDFPGYVYEDTKFDDEDEDDDDDEEDEDDELKRNMPLIRQVEDASEKKATTLVFEFLGSLKKD